MAFNSEAYGKGSHVDASSMSNTAVIGTITAIALLGVMAIGCLIGYYCKDSRAEREPLLRAQLA